MNDKRKNSFFSASTLFVSIALIIALTIAFGDQFNTGLDKTPAISSPARAPSNANIDGSLDADLATLYRAMALVEKKYLDAERIDPTAMLKSALQALELQIARLIVSSTDRRITARIDNNRHEVDTADLKTMWAMLHRFKDLFAFIKANTDGEDIDFQELQYTAVNGMLKTLDPHTVLLVPEYYRSMKDRTSGNFGGLGIVISIRDGELTVVSPIDGTPAQRAGLKAGDIVTEIGHVSTVSMPINDAVTLMRGAPGTVCRLRIRRKGWEEERTFKIVRDIIRVNSVDSARIPGGFGYVRIHDFQANTAQDLLDHLSTLEKPAPLKGLVLDLRSNPGGLLSAAINIADVFLKKGAIVTTAGQRLSERLIQYAHDFGTEPDYPIVVLVNSGSASASEIVAGALKSHDRAIVIGERTFGKGSVQELNEFPDNSALKITTAQYLTPGDVSIQSVGIVPHIKVFKMQADENGVDIMEDIVYREQDLKGHYESTSEMIQEAFDADVVIRHLTVPDPSRKNDATDGTGESNESTENEAEDEDDTPRDITRQTTYNFKFEPDFEIDLGTKILQKAIAEKQTRFDQKRFETLLASVERKEEIRLVQAMRKIGVDWRSGQNEDGGRLESKCFMSESEQLTAGTPAELIVEIKNVGTVPIHRLLAMTRSDFSSLDQRELAFGRLNPGEKMTKRYSFTPGQNTRSRVDDVLVNFVDGHGNTYSPVATRFEIESIPVPVLSFASLFSDIQDGNGDSRLQVGEKIQIHTTIQNTGEGTAETVYAMLSNESGNTVFMSKGRASLKKIAPGVSKEATFEFFVKPNYTRQEVAFTLSVVDTDFRVVSRSDIIYPVETPLDVAVAPASRIKISLTSTEGLLRHRPENDAPIYATATPGTVLATDGYVNGFYRVVLGPNIRAWIDKQTTVLATDDDIPQTDTVAIRVNSPPVISLTPFSRVIRNETTMVGGTAQDSNAVRDLFIFVNEKKVFFKGGHSNRIGFNTRLHLENGINFITIVAEENRQLEARKTIVIRRDRSDGMPYIRQLNMEGTPEPLGVIPVSR